MDKVREIGKGGWHPSAKDGKSKESWRGDFKGINQVAGWVGKGKSDHQAAQEHTSRPLASLKDPNAFGPPPKNVNYHGGAALPNMITPDRRGLGAPLSAGQIHAQEANDEKRAEEEAAQKPAPPPIPYRANTTGLTTGNLPKPPVRRVDAVDPASPQSSPSPAVPPMKPKPSLPPRLPPRETSTPTQDPPPSYMSATQAPATGERLNQDALNRLGSAGVSVPGLHITGQRAEASAPSQRDAASGTSSSLASQKPALGELQSRFSGLSTRSPASGIHSSGGTSFAQKQAALKTARNFRDDPASLSLADAQATAATANDFRERHGYQVASGLKSANAFSQEYNVAAKLSGQSGDSPVAEQVSTSPLLAQAPTTSLSSDKKKPPPPVPLSSKPKPNQ